jgi:transcriptional/translational regulatory protein YebC/TACO1
MNIKKAMQLEQGNIVIQKAFGYKLVVQSTYEHTTYNGKNYIMIKCLTENNNEMVLNHKDVIKFIE